jgi:hypothetical protein
MEVGGQFHDTAAFPAVKEPPPLVPNEWAAGRNPELFWPLWIIGKSLELAGNRTLLVHLLARRHNI